MRMTPPGKWFKKNPDTTPEKPSAPIEKPAPLPECAEIARLREQGEYETARARAAALLDMHPDHPDLLREAGSVAYALGDFSQAVILLGKSLRLYPDADAACDLGNAFMGLGQSADAATSYRRAIRLNPYLARAWSNLGNALIQLQRYAEAVEACERAISLWPDHAMAYRNLGNARLEEGRTDLAETALRKALALDPTLALAHYDLGTLCRMRQDIPGAIASFRSALQHDPDDFATRNDLGNALSLTGDYAGAAAQFEETVRRTPGFFTAHSNLLYCYCFHPDLPTARYLAAAAEAGRQMLAAARPQGTAPVARDPDRRPLRVGFVSPDLHEHPVGFFLETVLMKLDPAEVTIFAYASQPGNHDDALTERLRSVAAVWRPIYGISDEAVANQIRIDTLDILIDLTGHTANNRLPLFAWRPAPVQASWLGYFASTGLPFIDYFLSDPVSSPPELQHQFTERLAYLPHTRLCFSPPVTAHAPAPSPAAAGQALTFGCFQRPGKINDRALGLWSRILAQSPGARLLIKNREMDNLFTRNELLARFTAAGIPPERLIFEGPSDREGYFAAHARVDIMLDTFPFPGGTTTCEALWMGVPTVTLTGNTLLARQGMSLLSAAGLGDWVAHDDEEYVRKAVAFAADVPALARLRARLRQDLPHTPLMDAERFARALEAAFRQMWRQSCEAASHAS